MRNALLGVSGFLLVAATSAHADCLAKFGTDGPDTITANAECIAGQKLIGLGGDDVLIGGIGDDVLWGDACKSDYPDGDCHSGADILTGGAQSDVFGFDRAGDSKGDHVDTITDFTPGEDVIAMAGVFYHAGRLTASFIGTAPFDGVPGEVRYHSAYRPNGIALTIVDADLDGDGKPDFTINLIGTMQLTASNFLFDTYPPAEIRAYRTAHTVDPHSHNVHPNPASISSRRTK